MKALLLAVAVSLLPSFLSGCESVSYVKSEVTGTAKPSGGTQESIPPSKTYKSSALAVRRATLQVLDEQGYVYEENPSTGTIKTDPKVLGDTTKVMFMGATYAARLVIKLEGTTVTYRAKFDKKSNLTMGGDNLEYPDKEAELRKEFFAALDSKLSSSEKSQAAPVAPQAQESSATNQAAEASPKKKSNRQAPKAAEKTKPSSP